MTDQERAIGSALAELKEKGEWAGLHLFDAFHILHNVRKRLKKKEDIAFFARLLHAATQPEFDRRLAELKTQLPKEETYVLDRFLPGDKATAFRRSDQPSSASLPPVPPTRLSIAISRGSSHLRRNTQ